MRMMPRPTRPLIQRTSSGTKGKIVYSFPKRAQIEIDNQIVIDKQQKNKIILLWATARPEIFKTVHSYWMGMSTFPKNIVTRVAVDTDADAAKLKEYDVLVTGTDRPGVCFPCYCLSKSTQGDDKDIVIFASDDFYPPKNWDSFLFKTMGEETDKVLVVNDGIQKYPTEVITIPIMHYGALKKMNHVIYHPAYYHMHSDVELYKTAQKMDLLKDIREIDQTVFAHKHHSTGKRKKDSVDINLDDTYKSGEEIRKQRETLDTDELLKVDKEITGLADSVIEKDLKSREKQLSILICTIPRRKHLLNRLLWILKKQENKQTEILTLSEENDMPIGNKRNRLLDMAKGEYVCFIDDDDTVSDDYVRKILKAIESKPDCCSLDGLYTIDGKNPVLFKHSLDYKEWGSTIENGEKVYLRYPNHLNAIKRELALKTRFDDTLSVGEDKDFSERLLPLLKNESKINGILYHYLFLTRRH
jgi:hypothetical protein